MSAPTRTKRTDIIRSEHGRWSATLVDGQVEIRGDAYPMHKVEASDFGAYVTVLDQLFSEMAKGLRS